MKQIATLTDGTTYTFNAKKEYTHGVQVFSTWDNQYSLMAKATTRQRAEAASQEWYRRGATDVQIVPIRPATDEDLAPRVETIRESGTTTYQVTIPHPTTNAEARKLAAQVLPAGASIRGAFPTSRLRDAWIVTADGAGRKS